MAEPRVNPKDPRVREQARALFGDRADLILGLAERLNGTPSPEPSAAPRDAGKFVRQLAALYCENSPEGQEAQALVRCIIKDALELVNLIARASSEPKP